VASADGENQRKISINSGEPHGAAKYRAASGSWHRMRYRIISISAPAAALWRKCISGSWRNGVAQRRQTHHHQQPSALRRRKACGVSLGGVAAA